MFVFMICIVNSNLRDHGKISYIYIVKTNARQSIGNWSIVAAWSNVIDWHTCQIYTIKTRATPVFFSPNSQLAPWEHAVFY